MPYAVYVLHLLLYPEHASVVGRVGTVCPDRHGVRTCEWQTGR